MATSMPHDPGVPPSAVALLARTRPWVKLIAVLGFLYTCILVVAALGNWLLDREALAGKPMWPVLAFILMSLIYLPPAVLLWRYARCIGRLEVALDEGTRREALDDALRSQRGFWVYAGVALLLTGGVVAAVAVGGIVLGLLARR